MEEHGKKWGSACSATSWAKQSLRRNQSVVSQSWKAKIMTIATPLAGIPQGRINCVTATRPMTRSRPMATPPR